MSRRQLVVAALVAVAATSCFRRPPAVPPAPAAASDAVGTLGATADGVAGQRYAISCPFRQRGDRMTVAVRSEAPGRPADVAFVLLVKLTTNDFLRSGGVGSMGGVSYWTRP